MNIVITGANRGLGLEFARQYLSSGNKVAALARNPEDAPALLELARDGGKSLLLVTCDVGDEESVQAAAKVVTNNWKTIDLLINNAGVAGATGATLAKLDPLECHTVFDTNVLGPLRVTRAFLPQLKKAKSAKIVHITSKMGSLDDNESGGSWAYRMSKTALNMACVNLAHELRKPGIATMVLHPGWVRTDMGGKDAPLEIEESVAGMVQVIGELTPKTSGSFLDYQGATVPW